MTPELSVLFSDDVTVETVLMLYEQGICCSINDGVISEVIF